MAEPVHNCHRAISNLYFFYFISSSFIHSSIRHIKVLSLMFIGSNGITHPPLNQLLCTLGDGLHLADPQSGPVPAAWWGMGRLLWRHVIFTCPPRSPPRSLAGRGDESLKKSQDAVPRADRTGLAETTGGSPLCAPLCSFSGDLYTQAAEAAMEAMKGRLANQYYQQAEEAWAQMEEWLAGEVLPTSPRKRQPRLT